MGGLNRGAFMNIFRTRLRAPLLASASLCLLIAASPAVARDDETAGADPIATAGPLDPSEVLREAQTGASRIAIERVEAEPQIVIGAPGTPTTALDPVNINGIGQVITDQGGGFIGLCTGSLINPRTVLFAAHCVNGAAATTYGANSGGTAIGIGFESNLRANGAGQTDELVRWLLGGTGGAGRFQTNTAQAFYNANAVAYHPGSLEPAAASFLYADIALASLDTPAEGIPTWAMLFSQLPQPSAITANGTGYHVNISGYGRFGTGTTGATANSDFRRRIAENMLGSLASINDFENFLFGGAATNLPQNLYWIDFDDPRRGTAAADPRDFNAWRDNPTPREGITSQGDSGGPLILDNTYARQLIIGTLSGGYTRFFGGAPANGYGTASFYQPLYLYWDWIAANNPYRYVGNVAGSRNWTDPANWVTLTDPNYFIIGPNNQVVNGVPNDLGQEKNGVSGKFGQSCFESGGVSECRDVRTGTTTIVVRPIGTAGDGSDTALIDQVEAATDGSLSQQLFGREGVELEAQATTMALPAATIANGLPGATNFVPNNSAGNRTAGVLPRYFDVTLSAAGTTTLDTAVTVDKFTLNGVSAGLTITSTGSLTSLMDVTQVIGTLHVDGMLSAPSDFFIMTGGLSGSGTITAPFTTSMAGVIAPGNAATIGTLTFRGNLILASGTAYMVNLGAGGTSDRIVVSANGASTGQANLGGQLALSWTTGVRAGDSYTILTSAGGITGTFSNAGLTPLSAILTPRLAYSTNAVTLSLQAGNYTSVVSPANPIAYSYAQLLDRARGSGGPAALDAIYGPLDLQNAGTIVANLNAMAPGTQATLESMSLAGIDVSANFLRDRLESLDPGDMGGTVARYGQPVRVAALSLSAGGGFGEIKSDMGTPMIQEGALPDDMSAFVAGGFVDGDARAMRGVGGRDVFDGWYIAGGVEKALDDTSLIGLSFSYNELAGRGGVLPNQTVDTGLFQWTLYGKTGFEGGVNLDARVSSGKLTIETDRTVSVVGTPYRLQANDSALVLDSEVGISSDLALGMFNLKPRLAARSSLIGLGNMRESGGAPALHFQRTSITSLQGRGGFTIEHDGPTVRPYANATFVHEFNDQPNALITSFSNAGGSALFTLNGDDKDWFEVSGGLAFKLGGLDLSVSADSTIDRDDVSVQTYRGSVSFRF
jgi:hypothetical protein